MQSNIPRLRFTEFTDPWNQSDLHKLAVNGFSNGVFNDPAKVGSGYRLINVKDMYEGENIDTSNLTRVRIDRLEFERNKAIKGDIFFTRSSLVKEGIAYSNVLTEDGDDITFDGHLIKMRPDINILIPEFLARVLKTHSVRKQIISRGKTATMTTIGQEDLAEIIVLFPQRTEQQKIALFLSKVDEWVENLKKQKEEWEKYKKGMMQKIFSQKIRFKDEIGKEYPKWNENDLRHLASIKTGKKDVNAGNPNGKYRFYTCAKDYTYSDLYSFEGEAIMIAGNAEVGLCHYFGGKFEAYQRTYVLQNFKIPATYLFRYLSYYFRQYALGLKQTSAMSFIKLGMLNNFKVPVPSQGEQKKIAEFLTSIDNIIESKQKQIELAESWKKGLMQRMFI